MQALLAGEAVHLPIFDFKKGSRSYDTTPTQLKEQDILVIEGIHCLNPELSRQLSSDRKFKIYISALTQLNIDSHNNLSTADGRLIRRMVRDARTRNTTARETLARWDSVRRGEEKIFFHIRKKRMSCLILR